MRSTRFDDAELAAGDSENPVCDTHGVLHLVLEHPSTEGVCDRCDHPATRVQVWEDGNEYRVIHRCDESHDTNALIRTAPR